MRSLDNIDGFVFDLDGTVYLGESALPGAVDAIAELRRQGKRVLFVSNKPLEPRSAYANKLTRLGIPATEEDVITSAFVLARYLATHEPSLRYYVVGEANLKAELEGQSLTVVDELSDQDPKDVILPVGIDAVIVAFDRTLDYRKMNTAYQALQRGARYFATNGDNTCPMPDGAVPDAGAILAYMEQLTGRRPELVAGKPSTVILETALERLDLPAERCLMAGDRLETDIRMGKEAGMVAAVVLTGVSTREAAALALPAPDLILENIGEIPSLLS
ncbi:MAG: HAD-IIA family hydrolase [Caldilineaceae bacterium]|jgi:arabinose operon protein AraL